MYKVLDDNGTALAHFATPAEAIRYYTNNDDIASAIEPKPSDDEYRKYDANYIERVKASEVGSTIKMPLVFAAMPSETSLTAAEAIKAIEAKNVSKYSDHIKRLIDEVIEADGNLVALPDTPRYVLDRLTQLGYTVRPGLSGHINISAYEVAEVPLYAQVAKIVAASEARSHVTTTTHKGLADATLNLPINASINIPTLGRIK